MDTKFSIALHILVYIAETDRDRVIALGLAGRKFDRMAQKYGVDYDFI